MQFLCRRDSGGSLVRTIGSSETLRSGFDKSTALDDKKLVEPLGQGTWSPQTDRLAVQHRDRHDFHSGVAEEAFVGLAESFDVESPFLYGDLFLMSQGQNDGASDPVENAAVE